MGLGGGGLPHLCRVPAVSDSEMFSPNIISIPHFVLFCDSFSSQHPISLTSVVPLLFLTALTPHLETPGWVSHTYSTPDLCHVPVVLDSGLVFTTHTQMHFVYVFFVCVFCVFLCVFCFVYFVFFCGFFVTCSFNEFPWLAVTTATPRQLPTSVMSLLFLAASSASSSFIWLLRM